MSNDTEPQPTHTPGPMPDPDEAADAAERIECRRCGEVEPCSDRFLCATCQGRMDREEA